MPASTLVAALCNVTVLPIDDDHDIAAGWGQRIVLQPEAERPYVIFAHLEDVHVQVGEGVNAGKVIARSGRSAQR